MLQRYAFDNESLHLCIIDEDRQDVDDSWSLVNCRCHDWEGKQVFIGQDYQCPVTGAKVRLMS